MQNLLSNIPHMIMAVVVIAAATVLAAVGTITGGEAIALIAGAGGFSLGAGAGSASVSTVAPTVQAALNSTLPTSTPTTPEPSTLPAN